MLARVLVLAFGVAPLTPADRSDAGVPAFSASIYATCPDAPPIITLDGGVGGEAFSGWRLVHPDRAARLACLMQTCETDRKLREIQANTAPPGWWVGSVAVMVALAALAFFVGRALP